MIVRFDKDVLTAAVTPAMSAVSGKNTITAIEGIRITAEEDGNVILNSFDLEKGMRCTLRGEVREPGSFILNGQKFSQIIRNMPDDILIEIGENTHARISSGRSEFTINAMPGEEFPNTPVLEGDWSFSMPQCELKDSITKTLYAVANNEPRPALNGVFFRIERDKITVAATDSYRLAVCEKEIKLDTGDAENTIESSMVVPGKTVAELYKMLSDDTSPVKIMATRKHIIFVMDNISFFSRLIDAEYVQYEKFIPKNPTIFASVYTAALRESLERASLVTEDKALGQAKSYVKFSFEENTLNVSAVSVNGTAFDEIPVEKEGGDIKIGFNCRYLLDALRVCDSEYIKIAMVSPLVSAVITADESKLTEDEIAEKEKKRTETGVTSEHCTHLVVPLHMKD